jgi:hypothetical protein
VKIPSREADIAFAIKVMGWQWVTCVRSSNSEGIGKSFLVPPEDVQMYLNHQFFTCELGLGNSPVEPAGGEFSTNQAFVVPMMEAIERCCGDGSIVTLRKENGRFYARATIYRQGMYERGYDAAGDSANGALLAVGLVVADEVRKVESD